MSDDYETMASELEAGKHAEMALVRHMLRIGASRGTIPVELDGKPYLVCVEEATVPRVGPSCNN